MVVLEPINELHVLLIANQCRAHKTVGTRLTEAGRAGFGTLGCAVQWGATVQADGARYPCQLGQAIRADAALGGFPAELYEKRMQAKRLKKERRERT